MRALIVASLLVACSDDVKVAECTVACSDDGDCPSGLRCSAQQKCSTRGNGCPVECAANQFVQCIDAMRARSCNATGDGYSVADCGAPGCNEGAQRCNTCTPDSVRCNPNALTELERCDTQGLAYSVTETCRTLCLSSTSAHCGYLEPPYDVMKTACDSPATAGQLAPTADGTLDSNTLATCTGGVLAQINGPEICVVRQSSIVIAPWIKLTGARAFAFIADGDVTIAGALDASADGTVSGPGGGTRTSGAAPSGAIGGGGAGFRTGGGDGGGGGLGGSIGAVPGFLGAFHGGYRASLGGGGGSALALVSCRGTVSITGVIDVSGGGGPPSAGGGSGGVLVLAGLDVSVTAPGQLYSNGGGGGGSNRGEDGSQSSTVGAPGGAGTAPGGTGGARLVAPGSGVSGMPAGGGGGGSTGYILVYTPAGATPTLAHGDASPGITTGRLPLR